MFEFWNEELTPEEEEQMLNRAAEKIKAKGLELPVMMALEMNQPLTFLGSQAAVAFAPFIGPFLGFDRTQNLARFLSKRENIRRLADRLDSQSDSSTPAKEAQQDG